ncbi:MAG: histidine phosphatase family protein [Acidobacteriota bacterium]
MSSLYLIRHGQASLHSEDYDRLSPLGEEQCRLLAEHWLRLGVSFDRAVIGPRRRHRQSHDAARDVFAAAGRPWPEPEHSDQLDEHHGPQVLDTHRQLLDPGEAEEANGSFMQSYLRLFRLGMGRWARGELETPEPFEDWRRFRERARLGLEALADPPPPRGQRTAVFTSGGFVSAAVGAAMDLDDRRVLELSFGMRNASVSEVRLHPEYGCAVVRINAVPFEERRLLTFV